MIDLHCHILPSIDDGSDSLETSLEMARVAVADGIEWIACTPHIYPGQYDNSAGDIENAMQMFRTELRKHDIPLNLTFASDTHVMPDLLERLRAGTVPCFNGGRYFLLEFPHHFGLPHLEDLVFNLLAAGYVPVITHPERLHWIDQSYGMFKRMASSGAWMQITAGSLTGRFGRRAQHWANRMLDDGLVHILATDAHDLKNRAPRLYEGYAVAEQRLGASEASQLVKERPLAILNNTAPELVLPVPFFSGAGTGAVAGARRKKKQSVFSRIASKLGLS